MASLRTVVSTAAVLLAVSGCASAQDGREPGQRLTTTHEPSFTTTTTAPPTSSPVRTTSIAATCSGHLWAFGFSPVEAASGNRYLTIQVRNCGSGPAVVPRQPEITVRDSDGKAVPVQWNWRPAKSSRVVAAGHVIALQLHWLSNGRCERGGTGLDLLVADRTAHLDDCLQLGGQSGITGQPTVADATWS